MKAAAIILIVLVLAAVGALGFLYLKAELTVRSVSCIATDTVTQPEYFDQLKEQLASSTFVGTRFSSAEPGTADQYQFLTYTVRVSNRAFLTADILELRITPMEGDVLQIGDLDRHTLASGKDMELSATILTAREMHSIREATVTYYFWGIPLSTKLTLGK